MKLTVVAGALVTMACAMVGCSSSGSIDPVMLQAEARPPQWPVGWTPETGRERPDDVPTIAMDANGWAKTTVAATIIDTREFPQQRQAHETDPGPGVRPGTLLRAHKRDKTLPPGPRLDLPLGRLLEEPRVDAAPNFPAISATVWTPPDPTLAVGPDHIVATVNMAIAFYDRDGNEQFYTNLDSTAVPVSSRQSVQAISASIPSASTIHTPSDSSCLPSSSTTRAVNHGSPSRCPMTVTPTASGTSIAPGPS